MDSTRLRILRLTTLTLSAFLGYEGGFFYVKGRLLGKVYAPNALPQTDAFLVGLPDGFVIEYPYWAQVYMNWGLEPKMFAPLFVFLAILGVVALLALWRRAWLMGWVLLVPLHLLAILHWGVASGLALAGLVTIFWPGWRSFWFEIAPHLEED